MLECQGVTVNAKHKSIIENISFTLERDKITALIGKNGSGKTTLLKAIMGQNGYSGKIMLENTDLINLTPKERAKKIAFLPQTLPTPNFTVNELVALGRSPYLSFNQKLSNDDLTAINTATQKTNLSHLTDRALPTLSGGERQRAFLAMILAQQTSLLILDEPVTFMDISAQAEFLNLLPQIKTQGKTVLMVVHNLDYAVKYADNIIALEDGKCVFCGTKDDCLKQNIIENIFKLKAIKADGRIFFTK